MPDSKTDPSLPSSGALPSDADAPANDDAAGEAVTRALTDAFLGKKATQDRIREVVEARVPSGTQKADVEDLVHEANVRALTTTSLARSVAGMRPWVSRIAQNTVIDGCRAKGVHLRWVNRAVDVQELPPDEAYDAAEHEVPAEDPTAPPRPVKTSDEDRLLRWLAANVNTKADKATLESAAPVENRFDNALPPPDAGPLKP